MPAADCTKQFLLFPENQVAVSAIELLRQRATNSAETGLLLYIYGAAGCGKSHLVDELEKKLPCCARLSAVDLSTRSFEDENYKAFQSIRSKVRTCSVLICEDFHTLKNQVISQCFLINLLDKLLQCGHHTVITSHSSPANLSGFHPRLINRLHAGILASIRMPGLASRIRLLEYHCERQQINLSNSAIRLIAEEMPASPRELIATLQQIHSMAVLLKQPLEQGSIRKLLDDTAKPPSNSLGRISRIVARDFGVTTTDLRSHSRFRELVLARHCAMFLARKLTKARCAQIARHFGNRNHTSVVHACQRITALLPKHPKLRQRITRISQQLDAAASHFC